MSTVTMAFTGLPRNLHIEAGIVSLDNLHLAVKTPLLVGDMLVYFGTSCQEQAKAVHTWILVGIPTKHGCPVTVSICPSG